MALLGCAHNPFRRSDQAENVSGSGLRNGRSAPGGQIRIREKDTLSCSMSCKKSFNKEPETYLGPVALALAN
jgi:hypothetical protein